MNPTGACSRAPRAAPGRSSPPMGSGWPFLGRKASEGQRHRHRAPGARRGALPPRRRLGPRRLHLLRAQQLQRHLACAGGRHRHPGHPARHGRRRGESPLAPARRGVELAPLLHLDRPGRRGASDRRAGARRRDHHILGKAAPVVRGHARPPALRQSWPVAHRALEARPARPRHRRAGGDRRARPSTTSATRGPATTCSHATAPWPTWAAATRSPCIAWCGSIGRAR